MLEKLVLSVQANNTILLLNFSLLFPIVLSMLLLTIHGVLGKVVANISAILTFEVDHPESNSQHGLIFYGDVIRND